MKDLENSLPLDIGRAEFAQVLREVQPYLEHVLSTLDQGPAAALDTTQGELLAKELTKSPSQTGEPLPHVLRELFESALTCTYNTASGRYLAYIPGGGLPTAAIADMIAGVINRYVTVWVASPGLVQLEQNTIRWMADLIGLGQAAGGLLTTGGSMANFSAVVTAREERLNGPLESGVIYVSEQVHHSVTKAAKLAGIRAEHVVAIPTNETMQLCIDSLIQQLGVDRAQGLRPFMIVGSAGTTNTGAIDNLDRLADIADKEGLWFHVDAAYGGFFLLCPEVRGAFQGIDRADSVTLDPHKGMFLPYGTGALVVREREALVRAHDVGADYLPETGVDASRVDFSTMGPELSRSFRGLRVWLPLQLHGEISFQRALSHKLVLAQNVHTRIDSWPHVSLVSGSRLSVRAFRCAPPGLSLRAIDALNKDWLNAVNRRQRTHLSGTRIGGAFVLRVAILNFRTQESHIEVALDDLESTLNELLQAL
ncbi:MAG: aminotransferase class V-fold PLP-dependent enzyme [Myxococcota bacterium]|nr:aminotransferase class V-fold PLP-dependent enzyme [Myxococcota bacterium]